jgi:type VI protein secretion system component VasF
MAQTRRKRKTKHRGTAAGTIQTRGRTGKPASPQASSKQQARAQAREQRLSRPPTWKSSFTRAAVAAVMIFFVMYLLNSKIKNRIGVAASLAALSFIVYVPAGYYMELFAYRRRQRRKAGSDARRGPGK